MSRSVDTLILCEDTQAQVFILDALDAAGLDCRVRIIPFPGRVFQEGEYGKKSVDGWTICACGSQHVRENYPSAVASRRRQAGRLRIQGSRLIVHIDVDNTTLGGRTVSDRRLELEKSCLDAGVSPVEENEPVIHLIPRRNIETWIRFFLNGPPVDEQTDYGHLSRPSDASPAAEAFVAYARNHTLPSDAPASLIPSLQEFRKIL